MKLVTGQGSPCSETRDCVRDFSSLTDENHCALSEQLENPFLLSIIYFFIMQIRVVHLE